MRVRARCRHCQREFLFFQLYNAHPSVADRCPHCDRHLGIPGLAPIALRADQAGAELVRALGELAIRNPGFEVRPDSVLEPVEDALANLGGATRARAGRR